MHALPYFSPKYSPIAARLLERCGVPLWEDESVTGFDRVLQRLGGKILIEQDRQGPEGAWSALLRFLACHGHVCDPHADAAGVTAAVLACAPHLTPFEHQELEAVFQGQIRLWRFSAVRDRVAQYAADHHRVLQRANRLLDGHLTFQEFCHAVSLAESTALRPVRLQIEALLAPKPGECAFSEHSVRMFIASLHGAQGAWDPERSESCASSATQVTFCADPILAAGGIPESAGDAHVIKALRKRLRDRYLLEAVRELEQQAAEERVLPQIVAGPVARDPIPQPVAIAATPTAPQMDEEYRVDCARAALRPSDPGLIAPGEGMREPSAEALPVDLADPHWLTPERIAAEQAALEAYAASRTDKKRAHGARARTSDVWI